jgi:hypothetical protein
MQMRLEVYDAAGHKLFDNELRGGNVLDWLVQDGQAARLADGMYLCVVTVKHRTGHITQRLGSMSIAQGNASVQATTAAQLTAQQAAAVGPIEEQAALRIVKEDERQTALAHNSAASQPVRGQAALASRLGHFLLGKGPEQMRLSAGSTFGKSDTDRGLLSRPLLPVAKKWNGSAESVTTAGLAQALNKMSIEGNLSVGRNYSGTAAPADGMIIQGNVGIGTPTPSAGIKLEVNGNTLVTTAAGNKIQFGSPNGETGVTLQYPGLGRADLRFGDTDGFGTKLKLVVGPDSGPPSANNGITISTDGLVGINNTSPGSRLDVYGTKVGSCGAATIGWGAPVSRACTYALAVTTNDPNGSDLIQGYNSNAFSVVFRVTGDGTICAPNLSCSSDVRLKQHIRPLAYGLQEVLRLRPVKWQWKDTTTTQLNLGLVAQEVEPVLPELILRGVDATGSLGLNYMGLVPVIIKAIQEQQAALTTLKDENAALRQQKAVLETRLTALEQMTQQLKGPHEQAQQQPQKEQP